MLITTLTKRTAEDLADYLRDVGLKVRYLHSDIDTIERVEILRALRAAEFDILVGINLLREGLDLPEVSLVCILDADKEGYLRSQTSLIQTAGRAARHVNGEVVLFADIVTQEHAEADLRSPSTAARRQIEYNTKHGITPTQRAAGGAGEPAHDPEGRGRSRNRVVREGGRRFQRHAKSCASWSRRWRSPSANLEYERAALLRDQIMELKSGTGISKIEPRRKPLKYSKGRGKKGAFR